MKFKLATLALLASGSALAQSSVTIFGTLDATFAVGRGSVADRTQLSNSGYASSAIGFRGTEDLGGGMFAGFWIEAAVAPDSGVGGATNTNNQVSGAAPAGAAGGQGLTFARRSTASLGGNWGEIRLGRDLAAHYLNHGVYDPFRNKGIGTSQTYLSSLMGPVSTRVSNSISYFTPKGLGGFNAQVQYYMGENLSNAANADDGKGAGFRVGYEASGFSVGLGYGKVNYLAGDASTLNLGASQRLGSVTLIGVVDKDSVSTGLDGKGFLFGGTWDVGPGEFRASVSTFKTDAATSPSSRRYAVGYAHSLSKRTVLYGTLAKVRNGGAAAVALNNAVTGPGRPSTGLDVGVSHRF